MVLDDITGGRSDLLALSFLITGIVSSRQSSKISLLDKFKKTFSNPTKLDHQTRQKPTAVVCTNTSLASILQESEVAEVSASDNYWGGQMDHAPTAHVSREIVVKMKEAGINLVALDFDFTVIDIHTGGRWQGNADELATHIRPFFQFFVPEVTQAGLHLAVVTFSPQTDMIREVLIRKFGDLAHHIPIRGEDNSWTYTGEGSRKGKQGHMASAVQEIQGRCPDLDIHRGSTVLIDDDKSNIEVALQSGVKAFWLDPRHPDEVVKKLLGGF